MKYTNVIIGSHKMLGNTALRPLGKKMSHVNYQHSFVIVCDPLFPME